VQQRTAAQRSLKSCLSMELWQQHWTPARRKTFLAAAESDSQLAAIRHCTHTGRPFGSDEFVAMLREEEHSPPAHRWLAPQKGGRRSRSVDSGTQSTIDFDS
jgi:hypothetical protein